MALPGLGQDFSNGGAGREGGGGMKEGGGGFEDLANLQSI